MVKTITKLDSETLEIKEEKELINRITKTFLNNRKITIQTELDEINVLLGYFND